MSVLKCKNIRKGKKNRVKKIINKVHEVFLIQNYEK